MQENYTITSWNKTGCNTNKNNKNDDYHITTLGMDRYSNLVSGENLYLPIPIS